MHAWRVGAVDTIPVHGMTLAEFRSGHQFTLTSALLV